MGAKIPRRLLNKVELTFLSTYLQQKTEDRILVYADENGNLLVDHPDSARTRGSVTCDVELAIEHEGHLWDLLFDLHSHHTMGVFWSGTDDANERIRGPIFGVCSWKGQWPPAWLFRKWDGQQFVDIPADEVIDDG